MAAFKGTKSGDVLSGTDAADNIDGMAGDDTLIGGLGDDRISGGMGDDVIIDAGGDNRIDSGAGDDLVITLSGDNDIKTKSGDDTVYAGTGDDRISGGRGDDLLAGGGGANLVDGGSGDDTVVYDVSAGGGPDTLWGGKDYDTLVLEFTLAEWLDPAWQADVAGFLAHVAGASPAASGQALHKAYTFHDGTTAGEFENLRIVVDGVELDPADDPVTAVDDAVRIAEDDGPTLFASVLANDDVPDLVRSVELVAGSGPAAGVLAFNADGTFRFDPSGDFEDLAVGESRTVSFDYRVTDANGDTATATATITVTGQNDAPRITVETGDSQSATLDETDAGLTVSGRLTLSDVDTSDSVGVAVTGLRVLAPARAGLPDEAALTAMLVLAPTEVLGNGTTTAGFAWTFASGTEAFDVLGAGDELTLIYEITATDSQGATDTRSVTVTIRGTDDAPVAVDDTGTLAEDGAALFDVLANDSDAEGDALSVTILDEGAGRFPPDGAADPQPVSRVTVDGAGRISVESNGAFEALAEGQTHEQVITYRVTDDGGDSDEATLTVTVIGANDDPTLAAGLLVTTEDAGAALDLAALGDDVDSDDDGASLSYEIVGAPEAGTATISGTTLSFDPGEDFQRLRDGESRDVEVVIRATDRHGAFTEATVTVTVEGRTDAPTLIDDFATTDEDSDVDIFVTDNDLNPDAARVRVVGVEGVPSSQRVDLVSDGGRTFSAGAFEDPNFINVRPGDGFGSLAVGETDTATFNVDFEVQNAPGFTSAVTVTFTGLNDDPTLVAGLLVTTEDAGAALDLAALGDDVDSDDDGASLSYEIVGAPEAGTATISGTTLSFDPGEDFQRLRDGESRDVEVVIRATDRHGAFTESTVTVTVEGRTDPATVTADAVTTDEDTPVTFNVLDNDLNPDGDVLRLIGAEAGIGFTSYELTSDGGRTYTVDPIGADGTIRVTPSGAFDGLAVGETDTATFTATILAGSEQIDSPVTVTFTGVNDDPTLAIGELTAVEDGGVVTLDLRTLGDDIDSDDDGNTLTYSVIRGPLEGRVSIRDKVLYFDPGSDFQDLILGDSREVRVGLEARDQHGATTTSEVWITVEGRQDPPTAVDDVYRISDTGVNVLRIRDNDIDFHDGGLVVTDVNRSPNFSIVTTDHLDQTVTLNVTGESVIFDLEDDFLALAQGEVATFQFSYGIVDAVGERSRANVTVEIVGENQGPEARNDSYEVFENSSVVMPILGNDSDIDGTFRLVEIAGATRADFVPVTFASGSQGSLLVGRYDGTSTPVFSAGGFDHLARGETETVRINYTIGDAFGAVDTATATVTVRGRNDAPQIVIGPGDSAGLSVNTSVGTFALDTLTVVDADRSDSVSLEVVSVTASGATAGAPSLSALLDFLKLPGGDVLGAGETSKQVSYFTGGLTGDLEYLEAGETLVLDYTIRATDSQGATDEQIIRVEVTGSNAAPRAKSSLVVGNEDDAAINGTFNAIDPEGQELVYEILSAPTDANGNQYGSVTLDGDRFIFTPGDDFQFLNDGESRLVSFEYRATEASGATPLSDTGRVDVLVLGAEDAPIVSTQEIRFVTENQSQFGTGDAVINPVALPFLGLATGRQSLDETLIGPTDDPLIATRGFYDIKVGLQPYFFVDSGSISADVPVNLVVETPQIVEAGQTFTIGTSFSLGDGATYTSSTPDVRYGLDFVMDIQAYLDLVIAGTAHEIIATTTRGIADFTGVLGEPGFNILNVNSATDIVQSIDLNGLGTLALSPPVIETTGDLPTAEEIGNGADPDTLTSFGSDDALTLTADIDAIAGQIIESATGVPAGSFFGDSFSETPIPGTTFTASYDIVAIDLIASLKALQNLSLEVESLPFVLMLEDGRRITGFNIGDDIEVEAPADFDVDTDGDADGVFDFALDVDMNAMLSNAIGLGLDLDLFTGIMQFNAGVTIAGIEIINFNLFQKEGVGILPSLNNDGFAFSKTLELLEDQPFGPPIYDADPFAVAGWETNPGTSDTYYGFVEFV